MLQINLYLHQDVLQHLQEDLMKMRITRWTTRWLIQKMMTMIHHFEVHRLADHRVDREAQDKEEDLQ